jgi:hypothetical protein
MNRGRRGTVAVLLAAAVLCGLLAGCGLSNRAKVTTLSVDESGELTHSIIEPVGSDATTESLSAYIEEELQTSESVSGSSDTKEGGIRLTSCEVRDETASIVLTYKSWEDYEAFNGTTCFIGTISEAEAQGFDVESAELYDESGSAIQNKEELSQRASEWKVLVFDEPMSVRVPDKILYTTANLDVTGRLTAAEKNKKTDQSATYDPEEREITYVIYK